MQIQEHQPIPADFAPSACYDEGMRLPAPGNLERWFYRWQGGRTSGKYYASYVIGAQWWDKTKTQPLIITPKAGCERIDFLRMFSVCLNSGIEADAFSQIYAIDMEQPPIEAPELRSVLSPLLLVHYLSLVRDLVKRGLKKDYIPREENLKRIKGHLSPLRHDRYNLQRKRLDRAYCRYQEYSEDTPANRLLKKALYFSTQMLLSLPKTPTTESLEHALRTCLAAFDHVGDHIELWEVKQIKPSKLFRGYSEALRLAQLILQSYDYSLTNIQAESATCPVFWLDMALLYEHYVLGLLREAYGERIIYQKEGRTGRPDFFSTEPALVIDAKYIPWEEKEGIASYIVRQLAGYARDRGLFPQRPDSLIPCLLIYPSEEAKENPFVSRSLEDLLLTEVDKAWGIYRLPVALPIFLVQEEAYRQEV